MLTADDDLNNLLISGIYQYSTDSIPANCPFANAGVVEIIRSHSRYIQRVTRYGVAGQSAERVYSGTTNGWLAWVINDEASTTINANYVGGTIKFIRKNGMCLANYLDDWDDIPAGNMGVIGTIPEGYRPSVTVLTMCAPYNLIQISFYANGDITAYNYGSAYSGSTAARFSILYPIK